MECMAASKRHGWEKVGLVTLCGNDLGRRGQFQISHGVVVQGVLCLQVRRIRLSRSAAKLEETFVECDCMSETMTQVAKASGLED